MPSDTPLPRAAQWFVRSGIQDSSGGVARYYRMDFERNHPVSTEITGYAVSALLFLDRPSEAALAARFLMRTWDGNAMPFEMEPPRFTYFFDCGIIARGLLAAWRSMSAPEFLDVAFAIGKAMLIDFRVADGQYHPILTLPEKQPTARDPLRWSQSPGCYQLKAALAWRELYEVTGEPRLQEAYDRLLESSVDSSRTFLPGHADPLKVVDRLHAFLYFLEGLLPCAAHYGTVFCEGMQRVACHLEKTASAFERADVYAQLLRMRIFADSLGVVPLDRAAAEREASLLSGFQACSDDPRTDGGFYFGRKGSTWLPYINPVSTAFAAQALGLWEERARNGSGSAELLDWRQLI